MPNQHASIGSPEQLKDPNYFPSLHYAVPLGAQHVLAMFVSNVTPAIIIAGAAGFGFGSHSGADRKHSWMTGNDFAGPSGLCWKTILRRL